MYEVMKSQIKAQNDVLRRITHI